MLPPILSPLQSVFPPIKKASLHVNMTETLLPRGSTLFEKQVTVFPTQKPVTAAAAFKY
ncbi:hypothetical protein C2W63_04056 [Bacillus velezensis]|nr:hypothetical protein C2W63_04056 [Bacillus velezensis]